MDAMMNTVVVAVLLSWPLITISGTSVDTVQPTSILFATETASESVEPLITPTSTLESSSLILTSISLLPTVRTSTVMTQPTCFIGGSTVIKEGHSTITEKGLYLQFIKISNCGLSKRTFGLKVCYHSNSSIEFEVTLWIKDDNVYSKFRTLNFSQTNLFSASKACKIINGTEISFMENSFVGIQVITTIDDGGIILNPSESSTWCFAKGYDRRNSTVNREDCVQVIMMDVAVAALFLEGLSETSPVIVRGEGDGNEISILVGIVVGLLILMFIAFVLFLFVAIFLKRKRKLYAISRKTSYVTNHTTVIDNGNRTNTPYYDQIQERSNSANVYLSDPPKSAIEMISNPHINICPIIAEEAQNYEMPIMHSITHEEEAPSDAINEMSMLTVQRSGTVIYDYAEPLFDKSSDYSTPIDIHMVGAKPNRRRSKKSLRHDSLYERPASDVRSLLLQLKRAEVKKIKRSDLNIEKELGSGEFGLVSLATWKNGQVAIKTLNSEASEREKVKFLQEAAIMGQFLHENVIHLLGIVLHEPVGIVIEYAHKGDLRKFLIGLKPDVMEGEIVPDTVPPLLLQFSRHIAAGMDYLSSKYFVHRDLAARNILITENLVCKIADFGLSRDLEQENFYVTSGGKIPVKWTAPEALQYRKFSSLSDVWSFGCVLYEMWSLGSRPFEKTSAKDVLVKINEGYRLPPPPGCPKLIYKLMIRCWHPDPESRPIFVLIMKYLKKSDEELLSISEEDRRLSGFKAATLGYPLSDGIMLYRDLQLVYVGGDK